MKTKVSVVLVILLFAMGVVVASAEVLPLSSTSFRDVKIAFGSTGNATFSASLDHRCATISVTSCVLEKMVGGIWEFDEALSCPESVNNAMRYTKVKNYSSSLITGVSYRIIAVFDADGETMTVTSGTITY